MLKRNKRYTARRSGGNHKNRDPLRRGKCAVVAAIAAAITMAAPCAAHLPEGEIFRAFQFPNGLVPSIDGELSDWDIVDPSYAISTEQMRDLVTSSSGEGLADFTTRLWIGWNPADNAIYVAAEVADDLHQVDRPAGSASLVFQDDDMEVFIDADHSGGQYADFPELSQEAQLQQNGTEANHFILSGPSPDEDFFVNFSAALWYALPDGQYTTAALRHTGDLGAPGLTRYELRLVPFDRINVTADFLSRPHILQEGEIVGFNIEFNDFDMNSILFDTKLSLSGGQNAFRLSERFADLRLEALEDRFKMTATGGLSWGRIKASFVP